MTAARKGKSHGRMKNRKSIRLALNSSNPKIHSAIALADVSGRRGLREKIVILQSQRPRFTCKTAQVYRTEPRQQGRRFGRCNRLLAGSLHHRAILLASFHESCHTHHCLPTRREYFILVLRLVYYPICQSGSECLKPWALHVNSINSHGFRRLLHFVNHRSRVFVVHQSIARHIAKDCCKYPYLSELAMFVHH
jgi:hypothetical protein